MIVDDDIAQIVLQTPPKNFPFQRYANLNRHAFTHSSEYRILRTRMDPLLFGMIYFRKHLESPSKPGHMSLANYHVDMAEIARAGYTKKSPGWREVRDTFIVPRDGGKSTWNSLINPIWGLAHGWIKFGVIFSDTADQAIILMKAIKDEFDTNERLQRDFPGLCLAARTWENRSAGDTKKSHYSAGGQTLLARGIEDGSLGLKSGSLRPDWIGLDDIQPAESKYGPTKRQQRLDDVQNVILPMNVRARVVWSGTTVMYGCLIHEFVRAARGVPHEKWIEAQNFTPHYFPAIMTYDDGTEYSVWPQKWSLAQLDSIRTSKDFAWNYDNDPHSSSDPYWLEGTFNHNLFPIDERGMVLDFATTSKATSDYTGVVIGGYSRPRRKVLKEYGLAVKQDPANIRKLVGQIFRDNKNPPITTLIMEINQGGDTWYEILKPVIPSNCEVIFVNAGVKKNENDLGAGSKKVRARRDSNYYAYGWVHHHPVHCRKMEQQMCAFGGAKEAPNDDLVDAGGYLDHHYLGSRPKPTEV